MEAAYRVSGQGRKAKAINPYIGPSETDGQTDVQMGKKCNAAYRMAR